LRGMFAFVIWDKRAKKIFCARDRLGIKPFYFFWNGKDFVFASELKSILCHALVEPTIENAAIVNYLRLEYIPFNETPFKNIFKLLPGHTLILVDTKFAIKRYWSLHCENHLFHSYAQATQLLRSKIKEAIDVRLMSDVPIGAFLSGGVDSSVVVGLMSQSSRIKTQCVGFDQNKYDERSHAQYIAKCFNTDHIESIVNLDIANDLDNIIWHMDEPFADSSSIPTYYLCQAAKQRVTVCLSGDGGDELFAGYNWYAEINRFNKLDNKIPKALRNLASMFFSNMDSQRRGVTFLKNIGANASARHINLRTCFSDDHIARILNHPVAQQTSAHPFSSLYGELSNIDDSVKAAQWVDVHSYMVDDILMKVDKMSMAHSLEVRVPLIDHEVVELAFSMDTKFKLSKNRRKNILKDCVSDIIPSEFFERKKQGFSVPMREWLLGDLKERVEDQLLTYNSKSSGFFETREARKLWKAFQTGRFNVDLSHHIWSLLSFEIWYSQLTAPH